MIVKPGYKTTELLASVLAALAAWLSVWQDTLEPRWAALATGLVAGLYAVSRGLTKLGAYYGAAKATPGVVAPVATAPVPTPPAAGVEKV